MFFFNFLIKFYLLILVKSLRKMNLIESNIIFSLNKITNVKNKILSVKNHLLINSGNLLLFKHKLENLQKMQLIIKDHIFYWFNLFKNIKELKKEENIGFIYDILHHINNGILHFNKNEKLKKIFFQNKTQNNINKNNNSFKIIDILQKKC